MLVVGVIVYATNVDVITDVLDTGYTSAGLYIRAGSRRSSPLLSEVSPATFTVDRLLNV